MSETDIATPTGAPGGAEAVASGEGVSRREIAIALILTAALMVATLFFYSLDFDTAKRLDFAARYAAGLMLRQGSAAQLYNIAAQTSVQRDLFQRATPLLELHPPFEALLYEPLSKLPYQRAYVVWGLFNMALWMAAVYVLRMCLPVPRQTFRFLALCFAFFPLWMTLLGGQTSILLLLSYSLTLLNLKRGRELTAGACLGLGLLKFQLVLPFALIFALRGRWKFLAGFASVAVLLAAISLAVAGPAGLTGYVSLLLYTSRHPLDPAYSPVNVTVMPTLRGLFTAALGGVIATGLISALASAASLTLVLYTARRWRREDRILGGGSQDLMFAAALTASLLSAFYMFSSDLSALLPAMLLAIGARSWPQTWRKSKPQVLLVVSMGILYLPFLYPLLNKWLFVLCPVLIAFAVALFELHREASLSGPAVAG